MRYLFAILATTLFMGNLVSQNFEIEGELPIWSMKQTEALTFPEAWGNSKQKNFNKWRKQTRDLYLNTLLTPPPKVPFEMEILETERRDGYEARKICFNISEYARVIAYLLVPEGDAPFPAILMLHDHGAKFSIGKEKMVRPFGVSAEIVADADDWVNRCYDDEYVGDRFAKAGYVVLATDALFWNDRGRKEGILFDKQEALASNLLQLGMCWSGVIAYDDMQCVEFLSSLSEVDNEKIGALGFSLGAHRAFMLSAATDRVKAAAAICWMITTEAQMEFRRNQTRGQSAFSMLVPNLRNYLDFPHVASIACPKPMLFFAGDKDKLFPVEGVASAFSIMREVWSSQNASEKLITKIWDGTHFFSRPMQDETIDFFDQWLRK